MFYLSEYLATNHIYFSHFWGMFEAREYFERACDYFTVPTTEVPKTLRLVFGMYLLTIYSLSEVGSEHKVCFGASFRLA